MADQLVDDFDIGVEVPLEDGLVWAALHQDAIVVQLPDRTGPLAGEPVALLPRLCRRSLRPGASWVHGDGGGGELARTSKPTTKPARKPKTCARYAT